MAHAATLIYRAIMRLRANKTLRPPSNIYFPAIACIMVATLLYTDGLWRIDNVIYDTFLRLLRTDIPDDVVIIAIDEASIQEIGRWPWPRQIHADLIRQLSTAGARAIGYDVIFSEPDTGDIQGDHALAAAIRSSKNVVLPVLAEQPYIGAPLKETLPLPSLSEAAAAMGHVHIELGADGIARNTFLYEGLSGAYWPHFALALAELIQPQTPQHINTSVNSPYVWVRSHHRLIPFNETKAAFPHISFARVARGDFDSSAIKDKIVLVGVTATGLGDALPTPISALGRPTSGVEINANIFSAIRTDTLIQAISNSWRYILSIGFVMVPLLVFPFLNPRTTLTVTILSLVVVLVTSFFILQTAQTWLPPAAILFALVVSYPLWSWRRLEYTMAFLNSELDRLNQEPKLIDNQIKTNKETVAFIQRIYGLQSVVVYNTEGQRMLQTGNTANDMTSPAEPLPPFSASAWSFVDPFYWRTHEQAGRRYIVGVQTHDHTEPDNLVFALFEQSIIPRLASTRSASKTTIELLQTRIEQVQQAGQRINDLRNFISKSLTQLPEGVIIADQLGAIMLWNRQSTMLFNTTGFDDNNILYQLEQCSTPQFNNWADLLRKVLTTNRPEQIQALAPSGKDVLINLSPLVLGEAYHFGIIMMLSDITDLKNSERRRNELLSFISHDLRAPLVSILSVVELAKHGSPAEPGDWLNKIQQYCNQSLELAKGVVDLAQIDNGDKKNIQPVYFSEVAAGAVEQVWGLAKAKNIIIQQITADAEIWVNGDAMMLQRAVSNLLTNAIKYSPRDTKIEIHVDVDEQENLARCRVIDHGFGIPDEDLPHIFERFYRSKHENHQGEAGTGIGLAFVKAVAQAHEGQVLVQTVLGEGSEFCLTIPVLSLPATADT